MKQNGILLNTQPHNGNGKHLDLDVIEEIGNEHISTSHDTPMREGAFDLSDDEKIEKIEAHFREIMDIMGLDLTDDSLSGTPKRVAKALAEVEVPEKQDHWQEQFLWALQHGAIPAGRITSNAGALEHKPATSTINCTVSGIIEDSMTDILDKVHEAGLTLKAGCGIGYEYSTLRPKGAFVAGAGAYTSGPLSFMDI